MLAVGAVQYLSESTALTRSHHPLVLPPAPHPRWRHLRQIKTLWTGISYMHVGVLSGLPHRASYWQASWRGKRSHI